LKVPDTFDCSRPCSPSKVPDTFDQPELPNRVEFR